MLGRILYFPWSSQPGPLARLDSNRRKFDCSGCHLNVGRWYDVSVIVSVVYFSDVIRKAHVKWFKTGRKTFLVWNQIDMANLKFNCITPKICLLQTLKRSLHTGSVSFSARHVNEWPHCLAMRWDSFPARLKQGISAKPPPVSLIHYSFIVYCPLCSYSYTAV